MMPAGKSWLVFLAVFVMMLSLRMVRVVVVWIGSGKGHGERETKPNCGARSAAVCRRACVTAGALATSVIFKCIVVPVQPPGVDGTGARALTVTVVGGNRPLAVALTVTVAVSIRTTSAGHRLQRCLIHEVPGSNALENLPRGREHFSKQDTPSSPSLGRSDAVTNHDHCCRFALRHPEISLALAIRYLGQILQRMLLRFRCC